MVILNFDPPASPIDHLETKDLSSLQNIFGRPVTVYDLWKQAYSVDLTSLKCEHHTKSPSAEQSRVAAGLLQKQQDNVWLQGTFEVYQNVQGLKAITKIGSKAVRGPNRYVFETYLEEPQFSGVFTYIYPDEKTFQRDKAILFGIHHSVNSALPQKADAWLKAIEDKLATFRK